MEIGQSWNTSFKNSYLMYGEANKLAQTQTF